MKKAKIFFRADGNSKMGLGHVIRSLALAEMLVEEFECHFLIRNPLSTLKKQILAICQSCIEIKSSFISDEVEAQFLVNSNLKKGDIIVLDGYHFTTAYQQIFKDKGCRVICIDDIPSIHFVADAIINHAGGISEEDYDTENYTQFYLGLKYALLRSPFRLAAQNRNQVKNLKENNIFLCLGGADPNNDTIDTLKKCGKINNFDKIYLVLGAAYSHRKALEDFLAESALQVEILSNLSASDMVTYMQRCKMAITPPSTISIEYLSVGGELYLKRIADNQKNIEAYLLEAGLAFSFDNFPEKNVHKKQQALKTQAALLDGKAQQYYLKIFSQYAKNMFVS